MIEGIKIRNFRCLEKIEIDLKPLTILLGPNGGGKSSILYALHWFYLKSLHNPSLTSSCGVEEREKLGIESYSDLALGRELRKNWMEIVLRFNLQEERIADLDSVDWNIFGIEKPQLRNFEYGFGIKSNARNTLDYRIYLSIDGLEFEVEQVYNEQEDRHKLFTGSSVKICGENKVEIEGIYDHYVLSDIYLKSKWEGVAKDTEKIEKRELKKIGELVKIDRLLVRIFDVIKEYLKDKFFFVRSTRGIIPLDSAARTEKFVGSGENVLNVLAQIYAGADLSVREELGELMSKWADKFGLHKLVAGLEKNIIRARYRDLGQLDLALSSYGQRQLVTFLAQLIVSPKGSFIMIEEPEMSLHPEAQMELPILFGEIIKKHGKRIVITTHSSIIPLALSDAIEEGYLEPDEVAIYHVERDEKGYSRIKRIELTKEGYPKGGIPSFAKVEAELYEKMMERLE